jgi:hypothetical protein
MMKPTAEGRFVVGRILAECATVGISRPQIHLYAWGAGLQHLPRAQKPA